MSERSDGRNQGQGEALEEKAECLLQEWGFKTRRSVTVFGLEADVVGVNPGRVPVRLAVQCKDWADETIYPSVVTRLISVSLGLHAEPVLVHNSELSDRADDICKGWNVRCIKSDELELSHLPQPTPADEPLFERLPSLIADTLPPVAEIRPIYDPFHPRYQELRSEGRLCAKRTSEPQSITDSDWVGPTPPGFVKSPWGPKPNLDPDYDAHETGFHDVKDAIELMESGVSSVEAASQTPNLTATKLFKIYKVHRYRGWYSKDVL